MSTLAVTPSITLVRPRPAARTAPAAQSSVRLTRRGRTVVLAAALAIIAVLAVVLGSSVTATGEVGDLRVETVTVEPGHTLWQIAADANPNGDIRDTVDEIIRLNSLTGSTLQPGTKIAVPVYND